MELECRHTWSRLEGVVEAILRCHPAGLSEFDLIRRVQDDARLPEFGSDALRNPLSLFRTHFVLFHVLYRLGERLAAFGEDVEVHCLRCRILPRAGGGAETRAVAASDPLRAWYLDLANLRDTDAAAAERLVGDFWRLLARTDQRGEALAVLGLSDPVGDDEIKAAYRRLAMRHHPDRGGDTQTLQRLNAAASALGL